MPNIKEIRSIVDHARYNPAIDTTYFPDTAHYYWSSSTYASDLSGAWAGYFYYGNLTYYFKPYGFNVRCVR